MSINLNKWQFTAVSGLAALLGLFQIGYLTYNGSFATHDVIVASSPANVEIFLDKNRVGETPITVPLKRGTYILEAKKKGFENSVHAISVSAKKSNVVNIQLVPSNENMPVKLAVNAPDTKGMESLRNDLDKLKQMIISNPEDAATIPIMVERLRFQNEEIKSLRENIKSIGEMSKWYLGSIIAILVGLLGVIASLFVSNRGK
ncbi:MAG: PEGA domain-containing protein [Candidatus Thiodiazotropha taylori]